MLLAYITYICLTSVVLLRVFSGAAAAPAAEVRPVHASRTVVVAVTVEDGSGVTKVCEAPMENVSSDVIQTVTLAERDRILAALGCPQVPT
jgi:hypothetical protein